MSNRCCARCKTPYNCANPACSCHQGSAEAQAAWARVLAENGPVHREARFHMDDYRGHRDADGEDMATGGTLHPRK
jgi:hypothetical protein